MRWRVGYMQERGVRCMRAWEEWVVELVWGFGGSYTLHGWARDRRCDGVWAEGPESGPRFGFWSWGLLHCRRCNEFRAKEWCPSDI